MHSASIVVFVHLLFFVGPVLANNELVWVKHFSYLNVNFTMDCSPNSTSNDRISWILPNGQLVKSDGKYQLDGHLLHIKNVDEKDTGEYICEVNGTNSQVHTLNIGGPKYHSVGDEYYLNFVVAAAACAITCFIIISFCLIYHFRYRDTKSTRLENDYFSSEMSCNTKL